MNTWYDKSRHVVHDPLGDFRPLVQTNTYRKKHVQKKHVQKKTRTEKTRTENGSGEHVQKNTYRKKHVQKKHVQKLDPVCAAKLWKCIAGECVSSSDWHTCHLTNWLTFYLDSQSCLWCLTETTQRTPVPQDPLCFVFVLRFFCLITTFTVTPRLWLSLFLLLKFGGKKQKKSSSSSLGISLVPPPTSIR
jgi:hypothetical protein